MTRKAKDAKSENPLDGERCKRQKAVDFARASVGLEGFTLSETERAHAQRFIDSEIGLVEFVKPIR